ncbi:MAG: hypothetical protein U0105_03300 [Candidatus Obscuribacterales bacterium]
MDEKPVSGTTERLPDWVRRTVLNTEENRSVRKILKEQGLNTICESGRCPNKGECWAKRTATFMLMGEVCTRTCKFCAVNKGKPEPLDGTEPLRIVEAAVANGRHGGTDLSQSGWLRIKGSNHFARTITALYEGIPEWLWKFWRPTFRQA